MTAPSTAPQSAPRDVVTTYTSNRSYPHSDETRKIGRWFAWLYEGQRGYIRLNAGVADDSNPTGVRMLMPGEASRPGDPDTRRWCYLDPERPDLYDEAAAVAVELREQWGNVYTTRTTHRKDAGGLRATKETANPSPIVFVDDAPRAVALPWSAYIETGTGPGQGIYKCSQPTTQADARGVRVALGGDASGSNENKVIRVPWTFNTKAKHGGRFAVRLVERGPVYTLDQLRAVYPPQHTARERSGGAVKVQWSDQAERELAYWRRNVARLLGADGLPKAIKYDPRNQGWRIFADDDFIASWCHASGSWDASMVRYLRAKALFLRGYDDPQIVALVEHFEHPDTVRIKGTAAILGDLKGIVAELRAERPDVKLSPHRLQVPSSCDSITPTPPADVPRAKAPERPRKSRARKDRPQRVSGPAGYLAWLVEQAAGAGVVLLSQKQCAEALGCSVRTVKRYEKALGDQIERAPWAGRQLGRLFLRGDNIPAQALDLTPTDVVTADPPTPQQNAENAAVPVIGETHPREGTAPALPTPRAAVAEAFAHLAPRYKRLTAQRVRMFLDSKYPELKIGPVVFARLVAAERKARTWQRQVEALATMPYRRLQALSKRIDRILEAHMRGEHDRRYPWASALAPHVNAEVERREAMGADVKRTRARQRAAEYEASRAVAQLRASSPERVRNSPYTEKRADQDAERRPDRAVENAGHMAPAETPGAHGDEGGGCVPPQPAAGRPALDPLGPLRYALAMGRWQQLHQAAAERGLSYDALVAQLKGEQPIAAPAAACE